MTAAGVIVVMLAFVLCALLAPTHVLSTRVVTHPRVMNSKPHLFLATHDFEHMDMYAVMTQADVWKRVTGAATFLVVADRTHNYLLEMQTTLRRQAVQFVFARRGTVATVLSLLRHSNVCMFLYRDVKATGAYHMIKGFGGPISLVRIVSDAQRCTDHEAISCVQRTVGHSYKVEYAECCGYDLRRLIANGMQPHAFVQHIKDTLYPEVRIP